MIKKLADFNIMQPKNAGLDAATGPSAGPFNANTTLETILKSALGLIFAFAGIGFVFMIVYAAAEWIWSGGDKEKVANARKRMTNAIIGLIILSLAFVIIRTVGQIVGFDPLGKLCLPTLLNVGGANTTSGLVCAI